MPLFFGVIGIVLIICALNNTLSSVSGSLGLGDLIKRDFTGPNNFLVWIVALLVVGAVGYIPKFKPVSYTFFVLIFLAIILANQKRSGGGGLFANFFSAVTQAGVTGGEPTGGAVPGGGNNSSGSLFHTISSAGQSFGDFSSMFGGSGSGGDTSSMDSASMSI